MEKVIQQKSMNKARIILEQLPKKKRNSAGCMVIAGNKVLLLKRGKNLHEPFKWSIPGGRLEKGETPWLGAIRETFEETGINLISFVSEREINQRNLLDSSIFTTFVFRFPSSTKNDFVVRLDHESDDWGWFSEEEQENLDLHPGYQEIMRTIQF